MLKEVFQDISEELGYFFNSELQLSPEVQLMSMSDTDLIDSFLKQKNGGVGISLVNVEQENLRSKPYQGAPLHISVNFLVSVMHPLYEESLDVLSQVISFFQVNDTLTNETLTSVNQPLEMTVAMFNNDYVNMNSMWKAMGATHFPFALYKARLLFYNKQTMNPQGRIGLRGSSI